MRDLGALLGALEAQGTARYALTLAERDAARDAADVLEEGIIEFAARRAIVQTLRWMTLAKAAEMASQGPAARVMIRRLSTAHGPFTDTGAAEGTGPVLRQSHALCFLESLRTDDVVATPASVGVDPAPDWNGIIHYGERRERTALRIWADTVGAPALFATRPIDGASGESWFHLTFADFGVPFPGAA